MDKKKAIFSIIIPCFNNEKTLRRTIDRILNQNYTEYQLVLVDDGSTDSSSSICDEYAELYDNVIALHQQNLGLMRAWKNGVKESTGEYIVFCDADDYVDFDLLERLDPIIDKYRPNLVLYGMYEEYDNGDRVKVINRLKEGYYTKEKIDKDILPQLFSDGRMQSEMMCKSRCCKAFYRQNLLEVCSELNDKVSFGEDDLTTFLSVLNSDSIYCMGDYCPYHYVRTSDSMIGRYDTDAFKKIDVLYDELQNIAKKNDYRYYDQILSDKLSTTFLFMKKEICRNPNGLTAVINKLAEVRASQGFNECLANCSIKEYSLTARIFAQLMIKKRFSFAYVLVRGYEKLRGRDT